MGSGKGWISVHRKIQEHWIWETEKPFDKRSAWIDILLMVNHKPGKVFFNNEIVKVDTGERITSEVKLADRWGWSRTKVRTFLKLLEQDDMIENIKENNKRTRLKVRNYGKYQLCGNNQKTGTKQEENNRETGGKQEENTNNNENNDNNKEISKYADEISAVYNHWIELLSDVNEAQLTKRQKKTILTKLKKWSVKKLKQSISNYNEMYRSDYYYSHNFTMYKFIKQSNGAPRFLPGLDDKYDGDLWKDYKNSNNKQSTNDPLAGFK